MEETKIQKTLPAVGQDSRIAKMVNRYRNASEAVMIDLFLFYRDLRDCFANARGADRGEGEPPVVK